MKFFLKSFFINFLAIFFANYVLPGIDVVRPTKLPHISGDLYFALGLGFLNSLVYPILKVIQQQVNLGKIAIGVVVITFASYAIMKFASLGVEVTSIEGYLLASGVVSVVGILMNYLEMKHSHPKFPKPPEGSGIIT
jgi:uncharacterized membrane protein YvlD (DUF360 family)